ALHLAGRPTRCAWSGALIGTLFLPIAATVRPQAFRVIPVPLAEPTRAPAAAAAAALPQGTAPSTPVSGRALRLSDFDGVLRWGWGLSSVAALLVLAAAAARLVALRRRWRTALVDGRSVLLADDVGPAVAGLWPPRVVIPAWALNLTQTQRRLMLAHEDEHVRARDPWLLAAGTAALVLAPWNLALWWLSQRLRLAVEMDCDARVLTREGDAPAYGELLLRVGQRRARLPLGAPALSEPASFLGRRIRRMVTALPRWRWEVGRQGVRRRRLPGRHGSRVLEAAAEPAARATGSSPNGGTRGRPVRAECLISASPRARVPSGGLRTAAPEPGCRGARSAGSLGDRSRGHRLCAG